MPGEILCDLQFTSAVGLRQLLRVNSFGILNPVGNAQGNRIPIDPVNDWNHPITKHLMGEFLESMMK